MKLIPISQIHIADNRQRREFDLKPLSELAASIRANGLLHPIVLRYEWEAGEDGAVRKYFLVAGERRLRAVSDIHELGGSFKHDTLLIPAGEIPYIDLGDLNELEREEAELDENIRRTDLTWQERAEATAKLTSLKSRRAVADHRPLPSVAEISLEIRGSAEGKHHENTRREIIVSKHLSNPAVRAAKNVDEAFKILRREEESQRRVQLAETVGKTYSAETAHSVHNDEALIWLAAAAPSTFDVILTDPPYGISADEFGDSGGHAAGAHFYEDSYETWKTLIQVLAAESFRVAKEEAHLYIFCDITRFDELKRVCQEAGWNVFRTPLIWHKPNGNRVPWVDSGPQRKYELILYAKKGDKKVTRIYPDLVSYTADQNLGHPAQKPVALYLDLLKRSCSAGDSVLDPFAGSGPILPAANELKLKATAVEQDKAAYGICLERLKALKPQTDLLSELMNS